MVRERLRVQVPEHLFGVRHLRCRVRSNQNVSTLIKEVVLEIPEGDSFDFRAGEYVLVHCPPYRTTFAEFDIETRFREEWDRFNLWRHVSGTDERTQRAYSLANYPGEAGIVMLNVRIATPPPGSTPEIPAGVVSSYLFSRKVGEVVTISGPYGTFLARDTDKEMIFLGGGAGMAPMRSHILDQLEGRKTRRRIVFWYGARSAGEIFYQDLFDRLAAEHRNFSWHVVLSDVQPGDGWTGLTGFVHEAAYKHYLKDHPEPENCEYYVCGPPLMNEAVMRMLADLGVDRDDILLDDFGA
jgi:Na+-transporting NADH:ubiquinone oxidoreductase subunit F